MAKFEYNWATAEMAKLYLWNSRAQVKRKAHKAGRATTPAPDVPANSGHTGAGANAGQSSATPGPDNGSDSSSDSDSSDD